MGEGDLMALSEGTGTSNVTSTNLRIVIRFRFLSIYQTTYDNSLPFHLNIVIVTPFGHTSEQSRATLLPDADDHLSFRGANSSLGGPPSAFGSLGSLDGVEQFPQMEDMMLK